MSAPRRRTLADFSAEALAPEPAPHPEPSRKQEAPDAKPPARSTTASPRRTPRPATTSLSRTRTGIYFHPATFQDAKSAYVADLDDPTSPDNFARWIAQALDKHSARTTEQRAQATDQLPPEHREGSGFTRSFELPDLTIEAMNDAITADRRAGRLASRSEYSTNAIRHAIEQARTNAGGTLPPAPSRLPNKPVR